MSTLITRMTTATHTTESDMTRFSLPLSLALLASPALAHHEATMVVALPTLIPLIIAAGAAGLVAWRNWRYRN